MNTKEIIESIIYVLTVVGIVLSVMYSIWSGYKFIGLWATRIFPKARRQHRYAIMIAARNEEAVIGNLIDSIKAQDYPEELVTTFVVADNCTDNTARIAREHGAICYERFDDAHRTKGYALEFLVEEIRADYGIDTFEAYFIFDADNLLKKDYISRMNEAFDSGEKIVTSYRNTKNFTDNWIAASYGIHWIRTIRNEHRARSVLNLATRLQGTGYFIASEIIEKGWHYVTFTEDRAFAADAVVNGYRISYCDAAEFYDEQPTSLRIALRQRIRWGKGHLQAFAESGGKLFAHIFASVKNRPTYDVLNPENDRISYIDSTMDDLCTDINSLISSVAHPVKGGWRVLLWPLRVVALVLLSVVWCVAQILKGISRLFDKLSFSCKRSEGFKAFTGSKFFKGLKMRFMSYDMFIITMPNNLISLCKRLLTLVANVVLVCLGGKVLSNIMAPFAAYLGSFAVSYALRIPVAVYVFIIERRRIVKMSLVKKAYYCLMWPFFDVIGSLAVFIALFSRVEWKPIPHNVDVNIDSLTKEFAKKNN